MEVRLNFDFQDKMLYKITHFLPNRTKEDAFTAIMRYQKSETFEKWHYTFSHPMHLDNVKGNHTTAGDCGIRTEEFVKIEPVNETECKEWQNKTNEFIEKVIAHCGYDYCYEEVEDVVCYEGPTVEFQ